MNFADQQYRNTLVRSINNKGVDYVDGQYYIGHCTQISSKNTGKSLDECRREQSNINELQASVSECRRVQKSHQTNVDECRQVIRRVWTSVDQSLDQCRQMQMSVDESKIFTLIPEIVAYGPIFLLLQFCNSRPRRYANRFFYLLLLLITVFSLLTLAKPICLFNIRELELN